MNQPSAKRTPETPGQALKILRNEINRLQKLSQEHYDMITLIACEAKLSAETEPLNITVIRQQMGAIHLLADEVMNQVAGLRDQIAAINCTTSIDFLDIN